MFSDLSYWMRATHLFESNVLPFVLLLNPASPSTSIPMEIVSPRKPMTTKDTTLSNRHYKIKMYLSNDFILIHCKFWLPEKPLFKL